MKLKVKYTIRFPPNVTQPFPPPFMFEGTLDDGTPGRFRLDPTEDPRTLTITGERAVAASGLTRKPRVVGLDGREESPSLVVPEALDFGYEVQGIVRIVAFVGRTYVEHLSAGPSELEAETDEDRHTLDELGASVPDPRLIGLVSMNTFIPAQFGGNWGRLHQREPGLSIFSTAQQLSDNVAKFRELWRVLESAFGRKDRELVGIAARFKPLIDMQVTRDELQRLLVLRGRASHAATQSQKARKELHDVRALVNAHLARLMNLAERVIITKRRWGTADLEVDELAPLWGYIGPQGEICFATGAVLVPNRG